MKATGVALVVAMLGSSGAACAQDNAKQHATGAHAHNVTITAANFATLRSGGTVNVTSTGGGQGNHTHACTIKCA